MGKRRARRAACCWPVRVMSMVFTFKILELETCCHPRLRFPRASTKDSCKASKTLWLQYRSYRNFDGALKEAGLLLPHLHFLASLSSARAIFPFWSTGTWVFPLPTKLMVSRRWINLV